VRVLMMSPEGSRKGKMVVARQSLNTGIAIEPG